MDVWEGRRRGRDGRGLAAEVEGGTAGPGGEGAEAVRVLRGRARIHRAGLGKAPLIVPRVAVARLLHLERGGSCCPFRKLEVAPGVCKRRKEAWYVDDMGTIQLRMT